MDGGTPDNFTMQGTCKPSPSPKFTLLPVIIILQSFEPRKKKMVLANGPVSAWNSVPEETIVNYFRKA